MKHEYVTTRYELSASIIPPDSEYKLVSLTHVPRHINGGGDVVFEHFVAIWEKEPQTTRFQTAIENIISCVKGVQTISEHNEMSALSVLDTQWDAIENLENLLEAHTRLLIARLPKSTKNVPSIDWLNKLIKENQNDPSNNLVQPEQVTIQTLFRLVSETLDKCVDKFIKGSVEFMPSGVILFHWDHPSSLSWLVRFPKLSWPGINIRSYWREDYQSPRLSARSFHYAGAAISHTTEILSKNEGII